MSTKQLQERKELFTASDVSPESYYEGKILVLNQTRLNGFYEEYRTPQNQLFRASGGFGCSPITMGTAVTGRFLYDDEKCRMERYDFIGVLKNEVANELGYCPCGEELHEELVMNSLSRKDNETYICRDCEGKELQEELEKLGM